MFIPDLPDPPTYTVDDFKPSIHWPDVKYVLVYKKSDGSTRVISYETQEEFEAGNLATTFSPDQALIESWSFEGT